MADSYSRWVMTDAFANNSQAAINAGQKIEWVSIKTSDDSHTFNDLSGFNDTTLATATIRQTTNISSVTITGKTVTITGLFNSNNNTADYYIRTMFLVARYNGKEFLAGATVANSSATAFRMPAASGTEITEFTARPQISVSNTSTISATVNPVASATNERIDGLEADIQGKINTINADKQNLWNKLAEYVTKATAETIDGAKTFTKTIVGSITGNAGTATKLQTPRKINGTNFDGTADINVNAANDADIVHKSGNETILGNKTFTDYAKFTKLVNAPLSVRLVPSGTATIIDLINSVINEFGYGAFGTVRYMSVGQSFTDAPNTNEYLMIDIVTRGARTYVQILDTDNNSFLGNVVNGATVWKRIALDDSVVHVGENAASATKLQTARRIGGLSFDGTTDINLPGVNIVGNQNTSGNAGTATKLQTARLVGGVSFDGTKDIILPGVNAKGNQDTSGRAANATNADRASSAANADLANKAVALNTPRKINGTNFDGTADINVNAANDADIVHKSGNETILGNKTFTDYAKFKKLVNAPLSVRLVPSGTATIIDLINSVINEFGYGAFGTVRYMSYNQEFDDSPFASYYLLIDISTRGARTYIQIIDENSNTAITNVVNGALTTWRVLADDSNVIHKSGAEVVDGDKEFTGTANFTGQTNFITRQISWTTGIMQGNWNIQRVGMWVMAKFDLTSTPTGTGNTTLALPVGFRPLSQFTRELEQGDAGISQNGTLYINAIYRDQNAMTFVYPTNDAFPSA